MRGHDVYFSFCMIFFCWDPVAGKPETMTTPVVGTDHLETQPIDVMNTQPPQQPKDTVISPEHSAVSKRQRYQNKAPAPVKVATPQNKSLKDIPHGKVKNEEGKEDFTESDAEAGKTHILEFVCHDPANGGSIALSMMAHALTRGGLVLEIVWEHICCPSLFFFFCGML